MNAWDCEAERQLREPAKRCDDDRLTDYEPTERELAFRGKQKFRNNQHKDYLT